MLEKFWLHLTDAEGYQTQFPLKSYIYKKKGDSIKRIYILSTNYRCLERYLYYKANNILVTSRICATHVDVREYIFIYIYIYLVAVWDNVSRALKMAKNESP